MTDIAEKIEKKIEDHIDNMEMSVDVSAATHIPWTDRTRMTWVALISVIILHVALFFISDPNRIDKLGVALSWFTLAMMSIVMTFFGVKAWAGVRGR